VLELSNGAMASLCDSTIHNVPSTFLVLEKRGVRRIPVVLDEHTGKSQTKPLPWTLVATSDGFHMLVRSGCKRVPVFFSKSDLEKVAKTFPLYPYTKIIPASLSR
jgi:hypothetical protein